MLKQHVAAKLDQWNAEAEVNFIRRLKEGVKMHRETWANGSVMVGHDGSLANQMIPLARAVEIYREFRDGKTIRVAM